MQVRDWIHKFKYALTGLAWAVRTQSSFWVHLSMALAVIAMSAWLRLEPWRWAILLVTITMVFVAELINTSIEQLIKTLHPTHNQRIGQSLDVAAAAVLVAAIGSVVIGLLVIGPPLWDYVLPRCN